MVCSRSGLWFVKAAPSRRSLRWKMSPQPMALCSLPSLWRSHVDRNDGKKSGLQRISFVHHPRDGSYPTDENQAAAYMNKIIEKEIMRAPEQYLWIHRRFKTRPVGESSLYI